MAKKTNMKIKIECQGATTIDFKKLLPFQGKLKTLSELNYQKLKNEILENGFNEPISIWRWKGKNYILNGHQRLSTLIRMNEEGYKIPLIPINLVKAKSLKQAKKKVLALTSQYGEISNQGLYDFMNDSDLSFDEVKDSFRFPEINFDEFSEEYFSESNNEDDSKEDEVPDKPKKAKSKFGQIYKLGKHRLLCGDSTNKEDLKKLLDGVMPEIAFSDPPYNLGFKYESYDDKKTEKDYVKFCKEFFDNISNYTKKIIITPGTKNTALWCKIQNPIGVACWVKKNWVTSCKISKLQQWEPIFFFGNFKQSRNSDLYEINRIYQKSVGDDHPCPKQVKLIEDIIKHYSNTSVLDVFGGSGTTLIAAEKINRTCYMMEIEPIYCDVIIKRWENYTNKKAKLIN